ncbi:TonB family protein [Bradyrhizobium betae]
MRGSLTNKFGPWLLLLTVGLSPCWGQSDAANAWKQTVHGQLKSHGQFPPEACGRSGEPKLGFTLDRSGKVISSKLLSRSGVAAIDAAALAALNSAQPFPPAPPEITDSDLSLSVVLVFAKPPGISEQDYKRSCDLLRDEISLRNRVKGICRGC